jgi:hypothetical protein
MNDIPSPLDFFKHLSWVDGRPLLDHIETYRRKIFMDVLYTFDKTGNPFYSLAVLGRAKKNWKSADLVLAALYRFLVWESPQGNDGFILANDKDQAKDDLTIAKRLIEVNPVLQAEFIVKSSEIERRGDGSILAILPARDIAGSHGKTYLFIGFDEIHEYKDYDLLEALSPDPFRHDVLTWITSYNSIFNRPGIPLFDFIQRGKAGSDPKMYFCWYGGDFTTDLDFEHAEPELRANPSMESWGNPGYLESQRRRLPSHKYRRLHLNLPGMPEGAFFDVEKLMDCIVVGRKALRPNIGVIQYRAFVDMSGGSQDDAVLAIGHRDEEGPVILDLIESQAGKPPFNPRHAVKKFAEILKHWGISSVTGDRYAGETFRADFLEYGIGYNVCSFTKHQLYEGLEPMINAGEVELLDEPKLYDQLLGLVIRGLKIDHASGEHDDWANALAGVVNVLSDKFMGEGEIVAIPRSIPAGPWDGASDDRSTYWDQLGVIANMERKFGRFDWD